MCDHNVSVHSVVHRHHSFLVVLALSCTNSHGSLVGSQNHRCFTCTAVSDAHCFLSVYLGMPYYSTYLASHGVWAIHSSVASLDTMYRCAYRNLHVSC